VAWLLGQPAIPGPTPRRPARSAARAEILAATRRGRVLVLGGDQVYPTATRDEYENRFSGPYEAALPWAPPGERPRMFAVPGNHDWYDGLTSYMRLFCQQRWIGGWQTRQTRSYFALKLPQRWWLLGTRHPAGVGHRQAAARLLQAGRAAHAGGRPGDPLHRRAHLGGRA
jgi:hypothetical protein